MPIKAVGPLSPPPPKHRPGGRTTPVWVPPTLQGMRMRPGWGLSTQGLRVAAGSGSGAAGDREGGVGEVGSET